jgi:citrate lyase subunit beta/citryl-CoA lyase
MGVLRSLLFVPSDSPKKLAKARTFRPDAFILDLEDAVAIDRKSHARATLAYVLASPKSLEGGVFVRLNDISTEFFAGDLAVAVDPGVDGIVVPKCENKTEITRIENEITRMEIQKGMARGKTKLLPILETALGIVHAYEIGCSSERVSALIFGPEDYCADMGISRTRLGEEVAIPRMLVSQAAHAAGILAIDGVFTDFSDEAGLIDDTRRGKEMGYRGKALIHPSQILPVHRAFAPADEDVGWAVEVIETFEQAKSRGSGIVAVRGKMIDEPVVDRARRILQERNVDINENDF